MFNCVFWVLERTSLSCLPKCIYSLVFVCWMLIHLSVKYTKFTVLQCYFKVDSAIFNNFLIKICRLIVMKILMFVLFFWPWQIKEHLAKGQRTLAGDGMSQVTKTLLDLTQRKNFYAGDLLMSVEILRNVTDTFKRASYIPASDGVQVRDSPLNEKISEHAFRFWPWEASAAALWRRSGLEGKSTYSYRGHIRVVLSVSSGNDLNSLSHCTPQCSQP